MDTVATEQRSWSSTQAFVLFVACLFIGLLAGYLLRPVPAAAPVAAQASSPAAMDQVTPERLKHMADKKAEPLLAQLKERPNDAGLLAQIGSVYLSAEQFPIAKDYFQRSLAIKNDPTVMNQSAFAAYSSGDVDGAIATLKRVLELDPKNRSALYYFGMLQWHEKGDTAAAISSWERLLKTHPDDAHRAEVEQLIAKAKMHQEIPAGTKTEKPAR